MDFWGMRWCVDSILASELLAAANLIRRRTLYFAVHCMEGLRGKEVWDIA
jgi:hypothetical protein